MELGRASAKEERSLIAEVRRYFIGLTGFAFVLCWATAGLPAALGALALCTAIVVSPRFTARRRTSRRPPRPVRSRTLAEEAPNPHSLVPDDPSLVIELM